MRHLNQPTNAGPAPAPDPSADEDLRTPHVVTWSAVLDALREAAADAGTNAADWWAQDTVGGRATGDISTRACAVLAGIDDGDPAVLDALPACDRPDEDSPTDAQRYADAAPAGAPPWTTLNPGQRDEAVDAYRDGFDTAAQDRVVQHCRTALPDSSGGQPGAVAPRFRG